MSARTSPARNTSRAFFDRRSTRWCTMSRGRPANSRRSMPTTTTPGSRCSLRASNRPSRPAMPVTTTLSRTSFLRGAGMSSPEDVPALLEAGLDHRLHAVAHHPHLLLDDLVVVVGVAVEALRLAEVEVILRR